MILFSKQTVWGGVDSIKVKGHKSLQVVQNYLNVQPDIQLAAAKKAVQTGQLSVRKAGEKFGVPKSKDHLKGTSTKRYGRPPKVLSASEEKEIATSCIVMQKLGFPLTRDLVSITVRDFLKARGRSTQFRNGIPGVDLWQGFFRQNPKLVERKPEHLQHQQAQAAKPEVKVTIQ